MASNDFRIEHDFLGDREVPADAYYGVQTLRGAENFPITGYRSSGAFRAIGHREKSGGARQPRYRSHRVQDRRRDCSRCRRCHRR